MNKKLFLELEKRFKIDQELCKSNLKAYIKNCNENSEWLKNIIREEGWLSEEKIGIEGERYAWLIVQHSDDLSFQKSCLKLLKDLPITKERKKHIAYLTDRILVRENKKQIYGTQFSNNSPFPIDDEKSLNERREEIGLSSFNEYYELMQKDNTPLQ